MPRYEINNLFPIVKDVGNGKQPLGTLFDTQNLVPIKKTGSLTSRNGYTTGLGAPTGLVTLDKHLTMPATYPTSIDYHLYFWQASGAVKHITAKPFYHNGSTVATDNNGWVDISDKVTFTVNAQFKTDTTINGSTTNTYVLANAVSTYGLSATADYYVNWVLCLTSDFSGGSTTNAYLIIDYSVTGGTATFTLDNIVDSATGIVSPATFNKTNITVASLQRFFHGDKGGQAQTSYFTPSYISPAGYFTETGVFFSGGAGSTVGYKNINGRYYSKTFFNSVTANKYLFQGSYFEQAEVFKPNTVFTRNLLKSIGEVTTFSTQLITAESNRTFAAGNDWTSNGGHTKTDITSSSLQTGIYFSADGAGDSTTNYLGLASSKTNAVTNGTAYTIRFIYEIDANALVKVEINGQTLSANLLKTAVVIAEEDDELGKPRNRNTRFMKRTCEMTFTATGSSAPTIKLWFDGAVRGSIYEMNIFTTATTAVVSTLKGRTLKYYAVFVYNGFERSDPKYLGTEYFTISSPKVEAVLNVKLGELNKRITAIESYCTIEDEDTTSSITIRSVPLYFVHSIPICDTDTGWTFNTATGCFEYTDTITQNDIDSFNQTWEQRANRVESDSLTCSYNIVENCAGRIFIAQYYDYVDLRLYTNTIRYTNFNRFGQMSPSVLGNFTDDSVTYINAGAGTNITTLFERKGELVVGKEASVLRIPVDQNKAMWVPIIITNSVGVLNDFVMQSLGNTLIWTDDSGIYKWDGGEVELLGDKIWSQYYRDNKTTNQLSWIDRYDGSYNLSLNSVLGNFFKMYQNIPFPYYQNLTHSVSHVAVIKDGSVYFATSAGVSYLFSTAKTDNGTTFSTYIHTGNFTLANNKFCYIKEIQINLQISGSVTGTMQFLLYADTVLLSTVNLATTSLTNVRYTPPEKPAMAYQLYINFHGTPLKSNNTIVFNSIGFDYIESDLFGDVSNV